MKIKPIIRSFLAAVSFILIIISCKKEEEKVLFTLPSNQINKIVIDKYNHLWIATDKGIVCFDGNKWNPCPDLPVPDKSAVSDALISSNESDTIWLGSMTGLNFFHFNSSEVLNFGQFSKDNSGILSDEVLCLSSDKYNTRYIGTSEGLSIFNNSEWTDWYGRVGEEILQEYRISSVACSADGYTYATTYGGGISRFKYTDAVSGATTYDTVWAGLRTNYINTVIISDDTCQWYGTTKGAAYHTSPFTRLNWTFYSMEDGLISDTVLSIAKDISGDIWFGTTNGVSKLHDSTFSSFTPADGLAGNRVNTIAAAKDGTIWFGTNAGLSKLKNGVWTSYKAR